jgi:predicted RNase H-like HicB family nuclease
MSSFAIVSRLDRAWGANKSEARRYTGGSSAVKTMSSFSILVESNQTGDFRATVLGLPECHAQGATRDAALTNAKAVLTDRLATAELVSIELPPQSDARRVAGNFKDDPQWDEFQAAIVADRQLLDAELAEEYRQLDEAAQQANSGQSAA